MSLVSIVKTNTYTYPAWADGQFRPSQDYPEYIWGDDELSEKENAVYDAVRESLHLLGLDAEHYGAQEWNPLKDLVEPGGNILIKPNLVMDVNQNPEGGVLCLYTQPSLVAAIVDYVLLAAGKNCHIVVGDAPMQSCDWNHLIQESGYDRLVAWYKERNINISLVDFRELTSVREQGIIHQSVNMGVKGRVIDLGCESEFAGLSDKEYNAFRVTNYDPGIMVQHHNAQVNEYYISQYVLDADLIINMPKPKSHRKAGMTGALKNIVGINVRKEYLPHHSMNSTEEGGDEYLHKNAIHRLRSSFEDRQNTEAFAGHYKRARLYRQMGRACSLLMKVRRGSDYSEGSWYGNHTISRTISDLNKIVRYADKNGVLHDTPARKMLIVGDMIISGEKEGPVCPSPKNVGMIVSGTDPVSYDEAVAGLMGFDWRKIPAIVNAKGVHGRYSLPVTDESPVLASNIPEYNKLPPDTVFTAKSSLHFTPTSGWKGHIELE